MSAPEPCHMQLPEILDAPAAAALRDGLLKLRGAPLTLDASGVQRISTPVVQVLMAAARSWARDGLAFQVGSASPAFSAARRVLGLSASQLPGE